MGSPPSSRSSPTSSLVVIVDFDGTLTEKDGDFFVADLLLGPTRQRAYEPLAQAYDRLEITLPQYFRGYLELLGLADPVAAIRRAGAELPLRPGAARLLDYCRHRGWDVVIASEGLDAYILPALAAAGIGAECVSCNRLVVRDRQAEVLAAPGGTGCSRCLSCKATHVRRARARGQRSVVVGDGTSDLCAARIADLVLARSTLSRHCARERIAYFGWDSLDEVIELLGRHAKQPHP